MTRNPLLKPGIERFGRAASYRKRALYKKKQFATAKKAEAAPKVKPIGGKQNGKERKILPKPPRYYPAEVRTKILNRKRKANPPHIRSSLTVGTVVILLAGRFRGKRAVLLKTLQSGLLLVTGPFKVNGVPLKRVNPAYVIATSTKVDLGDFKLEDKFDDKYFSRPSTKGKDKKSIEDFFEQAKTKAPVEATRVADQKAVDKVVIEAVKKVPHLKEYLKSSFSLTNGQFPHKLKF